MKIKIKKADNISTGGRQVFSYKSPSEVPQPREMDSDNNIYTNKTKSQNLSEDHENIYKVPRHVKGNVLSSSAMDFQKEDNFSERKSHPSMNR